MSAGVRSRPEAAATRFESILFGKLGAGSGVGGPEEPDFFTDLNLDQVLGSMTAGREQYELRPFFYAPVHEVDAVRYRHEVLRDLEKREVLEPVTRFAETMRRMREHLVQVQKLHYQLQKQAWFLDAAEIYCEAVRVLAEELAVRDVTSGGFRRFRDYLAEYANSERFTLLAEETQALKDALAGIRYAVRIQGPRVTVSRYEGEPDYATEVEETFAKFKQGAVKSYLVRLPEFAEMDHVEARIIGLVAKLFPDVFGTLASYCTGHRDYLDQTIGRFDREVQFYLAYLELIGRHKAAGLPFCYPHVSARSKEIAAEDTFDLALANKLAPADGTVVTNDFYLAGPERMFVVSGPNNGGKTTFARAFGQLHYLASLGLPVPGRSARLFLPDRIYTHFEKEEDIETLRGKFEDELVRVHEILDQATADSIIVMNESFSSTTLNDALLVGTEVMRRFLDLGCLGVYVTFVDEIASLSEATVSMVSQIAAENPAERTFKVLREPAGGLAYAWAIAEKYGLTYERLLERID
ncbi:MAG: MutS-related protein [Streptosporangiaceae bacterium]